MARFPHMGCLVLLASLAAMGCSTSVGSLLVSGVLVDSGTLRSSGLLTVMATLALRASCSYWLANSFWGFFSIKARYVLLDFSWLSARCRFSGFFWYTARYITWVCFSRMARYRFKGCSSVLADSLMRRGVLCSLGLTAVPP